MCVDEGGATAEREKRGQLLWSMKGGGRERERGSVDYCIGRTHPNATQLQLYHLIQREQVNKRVRRGKEKH